MSPIPPSKIRRAFVDDREGRALLVRDEADRHWVFRWLGRLAAIPVVIAYVIFVWATQYLSWHGSLSLLEQHAFLVPAPLMGL